jgi:hypothetical protein
MWRKADGANVIAGHGIEHSHRLLGTPRTIVDPRKKMGMNVRH